MKTTYYKWWYYLLLIISFSSSATPTNKAPNQIQPLNSTFTVGDIVAEEEYLYRQLMGITPEGYFQVQNFYKQTKEKQSDIFIIKDPKNLSSFQELQIYNLINLIFDGPLTLWFINGKKSMAFTVKNNHAEGTFAKYYLHTGNKEIEGYFHAGKPDGLWHYWDESGGLEKQVYFKSGLIQWQKHTLKIKGI